MSYDYAVVKGSTSQFIEVFMRDSATGQGKTGLAHSAMTISYWRRGAAAAVSVTPVDGTLGTWISGGWKELGLGRYQFSVPDAALVTGADGVMLLFTAAGTIDTVKNILLTGLNLQDAMRGGLTSLPNANAGANGGLPLGDASGRVDLGKWIGTAPTALDANNNVPANLKSILGTLLTETAGQIAAGFKKLFDVAAPVLTAASINQTGDNYAQITHTDYGLSKLVRSATPANALAIDSSGRVTVGAILSTMITAIANEVENQIIDETDSEKVLTAITDKIAAVNPSLDDLTLGAIAAAARDAVLDAVLAGVHDVAGSPGALLQKLDVAGVLANTANADTFKADVSDIPTVSEFEARTLPVADYATPTNVTDAQAALAALIGDVPTAEEIDTVLSDSHGAGAWDATGTEPPTTAQITAAVWSADPDDYADDTTGELVGRLRTPTDAPNVFVVDAPAQASQIAGYCATRTASGALEGGVKFDFELQSPPPADGESYSVHQTVASFPLDYVDTDLRGVLVVTLLRSARYKAKREDGDVWVTVDTPATGDSFALPQTLEQRNADREVGF